MTFSIKDRIISFSSDRPGSYAAMFGPDGTKLAFSDGESSFDDASRSYRWAFELPAAGVREGQRFVFATTGHRMAGVVGRDCASISTSQFGGQIDCSPEGVPTRLLGISLSALPLQRIRHGGEGASLPRAAGKAFGVQAVLLGDEGWSPEDAGGQLSAALEDAGFGVSRFVIRPLGAVTEEAEATWEAAEHEVYVSHVMPGAIGRAIVPIPPGPPPSAEGVPPSYGMQDGRPFRVSALFAGEGAGSDFRLMAIHVGRRALPIPAEGVPLSHPATFPPLDDGYVADVGSLVTVFVRNVSGSRRAFAGRLLGQERRP